MLFCIWNNNSEQTFLFVCSVQLKLANIWEISNLCYPPKCKDIAKTIAEQEWHFLNKVSKAIKHRKTAMDSTGRARQPQFRKRCQEQHWGHWLTESCLNCRVNYCASALCPEEKPDSEIFLFYEPHLTNSWANLDKIWTVFREQKTPLANLHEISWRQLTACKLASFSTVGFLAFCASIDSL